MMDSLDISLIPPEHEQSDLTAFKPILDLTSGSLSYAVGTQGITHNINNNTHNSFQRKPSPESSMLTAPRVPAGNPMNLLPPTSGNASLPPSYKRENSLNSKKPRQPIFKGGQAGSRNASPNDGSRRNNFMDPITTSPATGDSFTVNPGVKLNSFLPQNGLGKYDTHFTDHNNDSFISTGSYGVPLIEQTSRPFSVKQIQETPSERYQTVSSNEKDSHRSIGSEIQENSVNNRSRTDGRAMEGSVNRVGSTSNVRRHFPAAGSPVPVKKEIFYKASDMEKLKLESSRRNENEKEGLKVEMIQYAQNYFAGLKADILANSNKTDELSKEMLNYSNSQDKILENKILKLEMDQQQLQKASNSLRQDVRISLEGQLENVVVKIVEGVAIKDIEKKLDNLNIDLEGRINRISESLDSIQKDKLKGQSKLTEENIKLIGNLRKEIAEKASKSDVDGVLNQRSAELWSRLGELKAESKRIEQLVVKNEFLEKKLNELQLQKVSEEQFTQAKLKEAQLKEDLRKLTSFHGQLKQEMEEVKLSKELKMQAMEDRLNQINQKMLLKSQLYADKSTSKVVNSTKIEELSIKIEELKLKMGELKQQSSSKFGVLQEDERLRGKAEQQQYQLLQAERDKVSQDKLILQQERERFEAEKGMFQRNFIIKFKKSSKIQQQTEEQIKQQYPSDNVASENSDFKQSQLDKQLQMYHEYSPEQSDQSIPHPLLHQIAPYFNNSNPLERQLLQTPSPQFDGLFRSTSNKQFFLATQSGSISVPQQVSEIQRQLSPRPQKSDMTNNQRNTGFMQAAITTPNRDSDPINFSAVDIFPQRIGSKDSSVNTSAVYTPLSNNNFNNINDLHNNINNTEAINQILRSQAKQQQQKQQQLSGFEQSNASSKMENPFNACVFQSGQNNFFDQQAQKSQQIDNIINSQRPAGSSNIPILNNSKISPQQNDNIQQSKKATEEQDFEIILKANNVHNNCLKQSMNQNHMNSQNMEDFLDQLDDFNENNIELVSENNEDQYYESDPEDEDQQHSSSSSSHKKRHHQNHQQNDSSDEQDNHKKIFQGLNNQLDIPLIQIAEEDNEEESHLGISVSPLPGQQESLICTKSNSIEAITLAKTQQNKLKITQQIAGLLQSSGKQKIACTRDEVGYLKDAKGFYIFDSEGRMIKTDKDIFNELVALELVQQV